MNFAIRYLTDYRYDRDVVDNLNALRVQPAGNSRQRCDEFGVRLSPEARLHRHVDYFGTEVVEFEVSRPHSQLTIDVRARVATAPPPEPPQAGWEALRSADYCQRGGEFLLQNEPLPEHPIIDELRAGARAAAHPLAGLVLLSELIPDRLEYRPGATYVDSSLADLMEAGAGVCQDFAHLSLALLRELGIAARYVSGYLFATNGNVAGHTTGDGQLNGNGKGSSGLSQESVEVDTHAWIEALLPLPGGGDPIWVGADPTNRGLVQESHVKIGHGRHYLDVPPIKGVYRGLATAELDARVTMTRLDDVDPASVARS